MRCLLPVVIGLTISRKHMLPTEQTLPFPSPNLREITGYGEIASAENHALLPFQLCPPPPRKPANHNKSRDFQNIPTPNGNHYHQMQPTQIHTSLIHTYTTHPYTHCYTNAHTPIHTN